MIEEVYTDGVEKSSDEEDDVQVILVDPDDEDEVGGFEYDDEYGNPIEWHTQACPCELCRVNNLELLERIEASRPLPPECLDGDDCEGCEGCAEPKSPTGDEILKERDEWLIGHLETTRPDMEEGFWRAEVESDAFNPPSPLARLIEEERYPGFSQYVRAIEKKGKAQPVLLKRSDGATILYADKFNTIFGEPGMAKTWIGIEAALASMKLGGRVLWWDFEDKPGTLHDRVEALGELGLVKGPNLAFVDYALKELDESGAALQALTRVIEWLAEAGQYSLVVIDAAESSGAPSDGSPVTEWIKNMIDPFRRRKRTVGVLTLDHVPKQRKDRPRGAIGSQAKLARVDGVAYGLSGRPWTKAEDGAMSLRLEKDRPGDVPGHIGSRVATITGRTVNGKLIITIDPPNNNDDDGLNIPMLILEVLGEAGAEGERGQAVLMGKVKGKGQHKVDALMTLIGDGLVVQTKDGKAQVHTITDAGLIVLEEGGE